MKQLRKNPLNMIMTPFIVVDAKALTEYNGIVKNLVKSRKFIVLIPNAGTLIIYTYIFYVCKRLVTQFLNLFFIFVFNSIQRIG